MPLPDILKDFVVIIKASDLTQSEKVLKLMLYLSYVERVQPTIFAQLNDAEQMPVPIPPQWRFLRSTLPAENLNVFQSLEAYSRGLGYQEIADVFSLYCVPVARDNLISRAQTVLADFYAGMDMVARSNAMIAVRNKIATQGNHLLSQAASLFNLYGNLQNNQPRPNELLTQIETYQEKYNVMKSKADSYVRVYSVEGGDEVPTPEYSTIPECVNALNQTLQRLATQAAAVSDLDNAPAHAAQYVHNVKVYQSQLIHMGHLFFEQLKKIPERQYNVYLTYENRLNKLTDFMGINRSELLPISVGYVTEHQKSLDRHKKEDGIDEAHICTLCSSVMDNPVKLPDGHYIDLVMAERLFRGALTAVNPFNREPMTRSVLKVDQKKQDEINLAVGQALSFKPVVGANQGLY